jgi:dihydroxyacetone kinase
MAMGDPMDAIVGEDELIPTKKFMRSVETFGIDCLEGLTYINTGLRLIQDTHNLVRFDVNKLKGKVAVVSGGGSGHDPWCAGTL